MDDDELFTAQMVRLTPMLFEALASTGGDPMIAARSPQLLRTWTETEQQARAALLLSLAWHARARESVDGETTAQQYAGDLQKFALEHTGDIDSFHGENFPAGPLPGRAGQRATFYAEGHDELDLTLEAALILFNTQTPAPAAVDEDEPTTEMRRRGTRTGAEQPRPGR